MLFTSWYPVEKDPAAGIFIKKHAFEISADNFVAVHFIDFSDSVFLYRRKLNIVNENFHEYYYNFRSLGGKLNKFLSPLLYGLIFLKEFFLGKFKFDLININVTYHIGVFLFPFLYFMNKPLVITEHWTGYFEEDGRYLRLPYFVRRIISSLFHKADKVIVVSEALKVQLDNMFGINGKTEVVYNSIRFPQAIEMKHPGSSDLRFLTISYLDDKMKNVSTIIRSFRQVLEKYPFVSLTIVGDGLDFNYLIQLTKDLKLQNNITFTGFVSNENIPEFYKSSDAFILNSNFETFSIVTAEALANGLPVIITKCRGPEFYVNESNGIKIDKNSIAQLASAIESIIENYNSYNRFAISENIKKSLNFKSGKFEFTRIFQQAVSESSCK
jgi:glycosyltransferase involved in cell wall biosynthesis